jgi:RimJ/RimL family protein N-acetyltransferase
MNEHISIADGHGPEWADALADLADRAAAAFGPSGDQGCLSVVDLEPWRLLDAWWLRRRLQALAQLSGRRLRYVPCVGQGSLPRGQHIAAFAPAWSLGTTPVELCWPSRNDVPHSKTTGQAWTPDGAVLILAGNLAKRLPQHLLLAHHGQIHEWHSSPDQGKWHPADLAQHAGWIAESIHANATGLPSAMLSLPIGYWKFLERAIAWASHGCLVVSRAEGWSSLAEIRHEVTRPAEVRAESPPVNFHWLAQHLPRLRASAHTIRACRTDAVQLVSSGLPDGEGVAPLLCGPLSAATRSTRADRARAVRVLAAGGDLDAAMSVLQSSAHDPALLRTAWDTLAPAAASASVEVTAQLGDWIERLMTDNPWIGDDPALLRGAGHLALACARLDLAQTALRALEELGRAFAADLAALARCLEQLGRLDAALAACDRALSRDAADEDALRTRERVSARLAAMAAPWRIQYERADTPLMLDPLHAGHAPMLLRQMRDPSIPTMTALPELAQGDDGRAWIQTRLDDGPASYAIVHRHLGLVGYLDLRLWKSTAFVCYWIGADFQGLGFCAPALALGCELALRNGIDLLLSSAYDDNVRSLRVLRKHGFQPLRVRAVAPDTDRTFVMLPAAHMTEEDATQRLFEFCESTGSGLRFVPSADGATAETSSTTTGSDRPH